MSKRVLNAIADELDVRSTDLSDSGQTALITHLQQASARHNGPALAADEISARYPDWAEFVTKLDRRIRDQDQVISALSDRLAHDPFLAENVHGMLSNITAIRSTASLLSQVNDIPAVQTSAFHNSLHEESRRLSETAQGLADYLSHAGSVQNIAATIEENFDQWLAQNAYQFMALDREADNLIDLPPLAAAQRLDSLTDEMLAQEKSLTDNALTLARKHLQRYGTDAIAMPLKPFFEAAKQSGYDPLSLSLTFNQPIHAIFRRLAVLRRSWIDAPQFGLITVTASGTPLMRQPLPEFVLPRHGNACTLWPLFRAFSQPNQPLMSTIQHDTGTRFVTLSYAAPRGSGRFGSVHDMQSAMLFVTEADSPFEIAAQTLGPPDAMIGTSCPICTNTECTARTAQQLIAQQ